MKRIIMHWTGGRHEPNAQDLEAYHLLVDGAGKTRLGKYRPEANKSIKGGQYAAHTRGLNTGSIGISLAAMHDAVERPFNAGDEPITPTQLAAFTRLVAETALTYKIPVTGRTVLTHAEVEPTLGVWQRNKWDIRWLPGMKSVGGAVEIGDLLRKLIVADIAKINPPYRGFRLW